MKVSIIIPIYKVEPYIERCIESVLHQTYRDLEIILVDDCTPDRSMELAKECIETSPFSKDLSFVYSTHDHNRGLSAARNTGIDAATGDYIYFLDSDDELKKSGIEDLVKYTSEDYDIIQGEHYRTDGQRNIDDRVNISMKSNREVFATFAKRIISVQAWNKLCKRSFVNKYHLYFLEGLKNEDELWTYQCFCYIKSYFYCANCTYIYHIRPNSIMRNLENKDFIQNLITIYGLKLDYYINNGINNLYAYKELHVYWKWIYQLNRNRNALPPYSVYKQLRKTDERLYKEKNMNIHGCDSIVYYYLPTILSFQLYNCYYLMRTILSIVKHNIRKII